MERNHQGLDNRLIVPMETIGRASGTGEKTRTTWRTAVFCRECKKKVEDCEHFVAPLGIRAVPVFDPKIKTLAYKEDAQILEIAFKNGQTWQLFGASADFYEMCLQLT